MTEKNIPVNDFTINEEIKKELDAKTKELEIVLKKLFDDIGEPSLIPLKYGSAFENKNGHMVHLTLLAYMPPKIEVKTAPQPEAANEAEAPLAAKSFDQACEEAEAKAEEPEACPSETAVS